jgi:hypothetical protein
VSKLLHPLRTITAAICACCILQGCNYQSTRQPGVKGKSGASAAQTQYKADVLRSAMSMLNSPEKFDDEAKASQEIVDQLNQWIRMVRESKGLRADLKTEAKIGDEHADDKDAPKDDNAGAKEIAVVTTDWKRDALIDKLPELLRRTRSVRLLPNESFDAIDDGIFLREAALLRDTAKSIRPSKQDALSVGEAFFDWTVRNIQIERIPQDDATPAEKWQALHLPLETLYFGRGTPLSRAWVFMLLARQRGLETVLLAIPDANNPDSPRPWAVGLVSGENIYLFDYAYGLPIPGPGGTGIATLAQAAADDAVLRQMDIPGDRIYPRKASELKKTVALVEASPGYVSRRMKLLESHLAGREDRIVLTTNPTALAEKLKEMKDVAEVRLWTMPFEVVADRQRILAAAADQTSPAHQSALIMLAQLDAEQRPFQNQVSPEKKRERDEQPEQELRPESRESIRRREKKFPPLRLGRLLHLRGVYGGGDPNAEAPEGQETVSEIVERGAKYYYLRALLTKQELDDINRQYETGFEFAPGFKWTKEAVDSIQQMRDDAGYWLGIIWYDDAGSGYKNVEQFLLPLTETKVENLWTNGARYNLARAYEAAGKYPEAIKLYEASRSPQQYGNRLRAERLKEKSAKK